MSVGEILGLVGVFCAIVNGYGIYRNRRTANALDLQRAMIIDYHKRGEAFLQRAVHLATLAEITQPYSVCDACGKICEHYVHDENGVTCIVCVEKHMERE